MEKEPSDIKVHIEIIDVPGAGKLWIKEMAKYLVEQSFKKKE